MLKIDEGWQDGDGSSGTYAWEKHFESLASSNVNDLSGPWKKVEEMHELSKRGHCTWCS